MDYRIVEKIIFYVCNFLAILIVIPVHEFSHAFAAVKNGDLTPKFSGRYTLNPFAHFDPIGFVMMVFFRFGWAKPVPVNPNNFRHYKSGCVWVSIAGVLANLAMAILVCPLMLLTENLTINQSNAAFVFFLYYFPQSLFYLNIGLFVFNLLPLYPLDGFRLYDALTVRRGKVYWFLVKYSSYILLGIILLGYVADYLNFPQLYFLAYIREWVALPIIKFWRLFI